MQDTKLKLDVVVKYFYPVTAGIETNMIETYSVLAKAGWDITIHTSRDTYLEKNHLPEFETIRGLLVRRYKLSPFGFWPVIDWYKTDAVCLHNFDIFPHFQIMAYTLWLKLTGKKSFDFFITPHGGFNPEWSIFPIVQRIMKRTYHFTLGVFLINRTSDGLRAVSNWEKEEMIKHGIKKNLVRVISNGVEDEAYMDVDALASEDIKTKVAAFGDYIIQIGRVYGIKNYETTIKALSLLPENIKYVITGPIADTDYKNKLDNLIQEYSLGDRVIFTGVIRGVDKFYLIRHAQMMVHMAIWESFCNVVHEGMSQGLICIVANNTALPYLIKNNVNGYTVETHDSKTLAEKILHIVKNKNESFILEMKERNKKFGLKNSWNNVARSMGAMYAKRPFEAPLSESFKKYLAEIKKNKTPCYFISPHLDDAVFSAGSLISDLSKETDVYVVTIFSQANNLKTLSIRAFLRQCGFKDALSLFDSRRDEDKKVIESLHANAIHLGYTDAPWRAKNGKAIYPTHRWHIAKGIVSSKDFEMMDEIKKALHDLIGKNNNYAVFGPSAIGSHVDHVIVRDICKAIFPNSILWADLPYMLHEETFVPGDKETLVINSNQKENILRRYKTQFRAMFTEGSLNLPPEIFFVDEPKKKFSVSVGMPAYNEVENIKKLLESLLEQENLNYDLLEIIVASDGSTDATVEMAKSVNSPKIKVLDFDERVGGSLRQNDILKEASGDILVMLDADIMPKNGMLIANLVAPFYLDQNLGIASGNVVPLPAMAFIDSILNFSQGLKNEIYRDIRKSDNVYLCHGSVRAFSKKFYKSFRWSKTVSEDAFSYLSSRQKRFSFKYIPEATVWFKTPVTFRDHLNQSVRFFNGNTFLKLYFDANFVEQEYIIPKALILKAFIKYLFMHPILLLSYSVITAITYIRSKFSKSVSVAWEISPSTKSLNFPYEK